jgi:hypothetical protein
MSDESSPRRTSGLRWLDAPPQPSEATFAAIRAALHAHPVIREAWLLRHHVTPDEGDPYEQTAVAIATEPSIEPTALTTVTLIADVSTACRDALGAHSWIFVNEGIRAKTEKHGLKIYERTTDD